MYKSIFNKTSIAVFSFLLMGIQGVSAQCAMCRAQLESMEDQSLAEGVNDGIVYLMAVPYILISIVAYILYRGYKKQAKLRGDVSQ